MAARAALLALLGIGAGCRAQKEGAPRAESASAKPSAKPAPPRSAAPPPAVVGCRVLAAKGPSGPGTPGVGTLLTGAEWLDLAAGVELSLKHTETTRELRVRGPARLRACPEGAETIVLARGGVTSIAGPGTRAGASVMLATPLGVVEYADAELTLDVSDDALTLDVQRGSAALGASVREDGPGRAPPKPVRPPEGHLKLAGRVEPASLATRCAEARESVAPGAAPAPSAAAGRGQWAVAMLEKRRAIRLLCARAEAAAGRLEGSSRAELEDQLAGRKSATSAASDPTAKAGADAGK